MDLRVPGIGRCEYPAGGGKRYVAMVYEKGTTSRFSSSSSPVPFSLVGVSGEGDGGDGQTTKLRSLQSLESAGSKVESVWLITIVGQ